MLRVFQSSLVSLQHEGLQMTSAARKAGMSMALAVGLLLLAGIGFDGRPALAQISCPLPDGVMPLAAPGVTAQQVEDGSASLSDFALAVRDVFVSESQGMATSNITTLKKLAYVGCLFRQEGGPWRSGSTYVVRLAPSNRVLIHAKDMALSGGQVNPVIYDAILRALGIDPAGLTSLAAARTAFADAFSRNGGEFNVPDIPGVSGYAIGVLSGISGQPAVVLAGFDLDASHLAAEEIEHIDPPVTAAEVVDRATLKTFVTAAGEYFTGLLSSGDLTAVSKSRVILRDADGPWNHESVYVAIMDRASRIITLHGGFPDRFEFRLGGIARDSATGELVVDQLVAAAESGPQGGFWEYYFDNPADDTDNDVLKVGYAGVFTAHIPRPNGTIVSIDYIVNSGFYPDIPEGIAAHLRDGLDDGHMPLMFHINTPGDGDVVAGNAMTVSAAGAPTGEVHFSYRPAGDPAAGFLYLGAAPNQDGARLALDTSLILENGTYELAALFTTDEGDTVSFDAIEVTVNNDAPADALDIEEDRGRKTQALQADMLNDVITADGVRVTVPPDALVGDDRLTVTLTEPPNPEMAPGDAVGIGAAIALASGQEVFREDVTIALPYPEGETDGFVEVGGASIPEGDLALWFFNPEADAWEHLAGSTVDGEANLVMAEVGRTGEFDIFQAPRRGGGGCAALPVFPGGGPPDFMLPGLLGVAVAYLLLARRRLRHQVAIG